MYATLTSLHCCLRHFRDGIRRRFYNVSFGDASKRIEGDFVLNRFSGRSRDAPADDANAATNADEGSVKF